MAFNISRLTRDEIEAVLNEAPALGDQLYKKANMSRRSRTYYVRHGGKLYSLKAVLTIAAKAHDPDFKSTDFNSGTDGAPLLRKLRFDVVHNNEMTEERRRVWLKRLERKGQAKFRADVIDLYSGSCALTGCTTIPALEAAHVNPVKRNGLDKPENGVLLRVDLHRLFDANLIAINPTTGFVHVTPSCAADYGQFEKAVRLPPGGPRLSAFDKRWADFEKLLQSERADN